MKLESSSFNNNEVIPQKYTAEGENVSPRLQWNGAPSKTQSFVLIVDDPDAPSAKSPKGGPWVHWVAFNLPAEIHKLDVGASIDALGGKEGLNDNKTKGYTGPKPPTGSGTHRYFFRIYALDAILNLPSGATRNEVQQAMKHHIIAHGELIGTYEIK